MSCSRSKWLWNHAQPLGSPFSHSSPHLAQAIPRKNQRSAVVVRFELGSRRYSIGMLWTLIF